MELTNEQIVDLIFEKKIVVDGIELQAKQSCLSILAELDQRLADGKIFKRQDTIFCGDDRAMDSGEREPAISGVGPGRRKKLHGKI